MNKKNYFLKNYKPDDSNKLDDNYSKKEKTKKNEDIKPINQNKKYFFEKLEDKEKSPPLLVSKKRLAAIYLILIGSENASEIMKHFNESEIITITNEILKVDKISDKEFSEIKNQFGKIEKNKVDKINGREYSRELLQNSFGVDKGSKYFIKCIEEEKDKTKSLSFIEELPPKLIVDILSKESDAVNAIILGMMESKKTADVFKLIPKKKSIEILRKISKGIEVAPEIFETIIKKLKDKVQKYKETEPVDFHGKEKLAEILKYSSYDKSLNIIDSLEEISPELAEELKEKIFTFTDIITIPKKSLDIALKDFSDEDIAFMLKGASDEIKFVFLKSVTKKRRTIIKEEINFLGKVRKKDVDEKRKEFIEYIRELEKEGKIVLNPENEIYVE